MKPVAAQPQVGGQQCGDGTGSRSGRGRRAGAVATAAGAILLVALAGCAPQRNAGTPGQPGAASPSPDLVQPQPGQPGAETTPLANTTPFERQPSAGATGATGADWLAALGALFAPFITPGTPSTFVGNAADALRAESDNQRQAENLPNLIYPPPDPNLVYPPATGGDVAAAGEANAPRA